MDSVELYTYAKLHGVPVELVQQVAKTGKLPVVNFAAGGVATPADAALMMQLVYIYSYFDYYCREWMVSL